MRARSPCIRSGRKKRRGQSHSSTVHGDQDKTDPSPVAARHGAPGSGSLSAWMATNQSTGPASCCGKNEESPLEVIALYGPRLPVAVAYRPAWSRDRPLSPAAWSTERIDVACRLKRRGPGSSEARSPWAPFGRSLEPRSEPTPTTCPTECRRASGRSWRESRRGSRKCESPASGQSQVVTKKPTAQHVTEQYLLQGAYYALEQRGLLLRDAKTLFCSQTPSRFDANATVGRGPCATETSGVAKAVELAKTKRAAVE
jgi:hypothetical protein